MSVVTFVLMEFKKLRGNRTFLITVLGALLIPIISLLVIIFTGINQTVVENIEGVYMFYLKLLSLIFAAVVLNYLFTIDLETHSLKSIVPLTVSRSEYLNGKLATALVWMLALGLITIVASIVLFSLSGAGGFDLMIILKDAGSYLIGTVFLFLVMIPIAFITVFTRNPTAGLVTSILLLFIGLFADAQFTYNPWQLPYKVFFESNFINTTLAIVIIIIVGIIGYCLLRWIFFKRDIDL